MTTFPPQQKGDTDLLRRPPQYPIPPNGLSNRINRLLTLSAFTIEKKAIALRTSLDHLLATGGKLKFHKVQKSVNIAGKTNPRAEYYSKCHGGSVPPLACWPSSGCAGDFRSGPVTTGTLINRTQIEAASFQTQNCGKIHRGGETNVAGCFFLKDGFIPNCQWLCANHGCWSGGFLRPASCRRDTLFPACRPRPDNKACQRRRWLRAWTFFSPRHI